MRLLKPSRAYLSFSNIPNSLPGPGPGTRKMPNRFQFLSFLCVLSELVPCCKYIQDRQCGSMKSPLGTRTFTWECWVEAQLLFPWSSSQLMHQRTQQLMAQVQMPELPPSTLEDPDRVPGFWVQLGSVLVTSILGSEKEEISLSLSPNKSIFLKAHL